MLSTSTPTVEFYAAIATNPQLLANGYQLIRDYLFQDQQHRRDTILNLLNPTTPIISLVLNLYPNEVFLSQQIDDAQKDSTVTFILGLIVQQLVKPPEAYRPKEVSQLIEFMHKIHNNLGFERWVGLYINAFSAVAEQNRSKFAQFILSILRSADDRVSALSQELAPKLIQFHFDNSEDRLEIYYYILKSLAYKVDTDPETIDSQIRPHLEAILEYAIKNMKLSPKSLKFSLKTMTLLFGDYGQPCPTLLIAQIEATSEYLVCQYIGFLNSSADFQKGEDDAQDEQQPIEMALYQMLELLMALFGSKAKINIQKVIYLCVISTFLGQAQYQKYVTFSDQYLMDVEDEGETNIRNKSTYFMNELIDHDKYGKKCIEFLREYSAQILLNLQYIQTNLLTFLNNHHLPQRTLSVPELYTESALFILHSFTDELLQGKVNEISSILVKEVRASPPSSINPILSVLILNKCARTGTQSQKSFYLTFLRSLVGPFCGNVGMLISVARGIFLFAPVPQLQISSNPQQGVPAILVSNLNEYLFKQDSAQEEAGYLILQFFTHLLKCSSNQPILQQIIPFEKQILLLKRFLSTGMTSKVVMQLTVKLANPRTLQAIFQEIEHGFAKDQNLSEIISICIKQHSITVSQSQIIRLCQVYTSRLDYIANLIGAFTECYSLQNQELIEFLSKGGRKEWLPGLLRQGKLKHIDSHFINSVKLITHQIQSPQQLENQLLVPYFSIIKDTDTAISLLNGQSILFDFFEKLYRYARLFQGPHLKIITSHIFISLAQKLPNLAPKVIELVKSYGNIESCQWEDEDQFADLGQNFDFNEGLLDKIFSRIVNERVEEVFKTVFGQLAWDSKRLYQRLASLESVH